MNRKGDISWQDLNPNFFKTLSQSLETKLIIQIKQSRFKSRWFLASLLICLAVSSYGCQTGYLSWESASLLNGRSRIQTLAGPTLGVFK